MQTSKMLLLGGIGLGAYWLLTEAKDAGLRLSGMGSTGNNERTPIIGGPVDPDWSRGVPGTYTVRMRAEAVPLSAPKTYLSPTKFNEYLRGKGVNARVTAVRFISSDNVRSANWALDVLDPDADRAISDVTYEFTVQIGSGTDGGLGALPGIAVTAIVLTACATVLAVVVTVFGDVVIEKIVKALKEVPKGMAEGLLYVGLAAVVVIALAKRSGASVRTKSFSFG